MARTAKVHRLTAMAVKRYAEAPAQAKPLHDGGGLYLRKRDASALWYLRLTDPSTGAQQWHRMFPDDPTGAYPHKSLGDARAQARRLWNLRSAGIDPRVQRHDEMRERQARAEAIEREAQRRLSVKELFERWAATDLRPHLRADGKRVGRCDGGQYTREQFERRVFPKLGTYPVAGVSRGQWIEILDAVKAEGKLRTANVLLADLKQMLRFAMARDLIERNPLDSVLKRDVGGASVERDRVLSREELAQLSGLLRQSTLSDQCRAGVWLILATGVRVGELIGATWASPAADEGELMPIAQANNAKFGVVDLQRRTWQLRETKNQRAHTIHLSNFAVDKFCTLAKIQQTRLNGKAQPVPWIFPNADGSGPVGVKTFGKQLGDRQREPERRLKNRTLNSAALALTGGRWTAHDLRRTAATLMAELGVSGDVIDECLNHQIESRVRRVYIRDRRIGEQAKAFDALGTLLTSIAAGSTTASTESKAGETDAWPVNAVERRAVAV